MIRSLIPPPLRLPLRKMLNTIRDTWRGYLFRFARERAAPAGLQIALQLTQPLHPNPAKVHNLLLAQKGIESVVVMPGEIFSFWKAVGAPSRQNGYRESRSIVGNTVRQSIGGGLCQLSGLIYHLALLAGLDILERHSHSMDIYDEQTRFTPLGSDATVVYGYKDLRIQNNLPGPIRFIFIFEKETLTAQILTSQTVVPREVRFEKTPASDSSVTVHTYRDGRKINTSFYRINPLPPHR